MYKCNKDIALFEVCNIFLKFSAEDCTSVRDGCVTEETEGTYRFLLFCLAEK